MKSVTDIWLTKEQQKRLAQICRFLERDFQRQGLGERLIEGVISYYCPCCKSRTVWQKGDKNHDFGGHTKRCLAGKVLRVSTACDKKQAINKQDAIDICKAILKVKIVAAYSHLSIYAAELLILTSQPVCIWHEML